MSNQEKLSSLIILLISIFLFYKTHEYFEKRELIENTKQLERGYTYQLLLK